MYSHKKHLFFLLFVPLLLSAGCGEESQPTRPADPVPTRMVISPPSGEITALGQTLQLSATLLDSNGNTLTGYAINWSSSSAAVASVDRNGLVTAHSDGSTRITVAWSGIQTNITVSVVRSPSRIVLAQTEVLLTSPGETRTLDAVVEDAGGAEIPDAPRTWTSERPDVASVDDQGVVTAHMNGETRVTITSGTLSASVSVKVVFPPRANRIVVSPESVNLTSIGETVQLSARVLDADDMEIQDPVLAWTSEDPEVASVDDQGVVTAQSNGTTRITVTSDMVSVSVPVSVDETATDRESLVEFYHATDGPNWKNNTNWLSDKPLGQWHGVSVDSVGYVVSIWLFDNDLNGHLPVSLTSLSRLEVLALSDSELSGNIPAELGMLESLQRVILTHSKLTGSVPSSLGRLSNLTVLDLQYNQLTGSIPPSLGDLSNLAYLRLAGNPMSGPIPTSLGQLNKLQRLYLSQAGLTGEIPTSFGGLTSLIELFMEANSLSGSIPEELGRLEHLISLRLTDNAGLTGPLPRSFLDLDLEALYLFETQVCIPRDLEFEEWKLSFHTRYAMDCEAGPDLTALEAMYNWMGGKDWTDNTNWRSAKPLSEWFGVAVDDTGRVESVELPGNGLAGDIEIAVGGLSALKRLNLGGNGLTGEIPGEFGALENLEELRLNDNAGLTGALPDELVNLPLDVLWLQGTAVCAPDNSTLQAWLRQIPDRQVTDCEPTMVDPVDPVDPPVDPVDPIDPPVDTGDTGDKEVLIALYNATDGENWQRKTNWLGNLHIGEWDGVVTNSAGRVVELDLWNNRLSGQIPSALGGLTGLKKLSLALNTLEGAIPSALGGLTSLQFLDLSDNYLNGSIPSMLGNLTNLSSLYLYDNDLSGRIPSSLGRMSRLANLHLDENELTGGIPSSLGDLTNLKSLSLDWNDLTGGIPSVLGGLSNLELLDLGHNDLTGNIPSTLGNLALLETLILEHNDLSGGLPSSLADLEHLSILQLSRNRRLSGPISYAFIDSNLKILLAGGTDLCSPPDSRFGRWLASLERRDISRCPTSEEDRATLVAFYNATDGPNWSSTSRINWLSTKRINEWSGVTVDGTGRVSVLEVGSGGLSGELPALLGNLANLKRLYLARNNLTGSIPSALGNLANLKDLYLHRNSLSGSIPSELGNLNNLDGLGLENNMLNGSIPPSLGNLGKLRYIFLANNSLSGGIPASLGKLTNLLHLDLQNNEEMSGALPGALTGMTSLDTLWLDGTGLCVPNTEAFQTWLDGIETKQFEYCE